MKLHEYGVFKKFPQILAYVERYSAGEAIVNDINFLFRGFPLYK